MKFLAVLAALAPAPALALSCVPWGVPDAYAKADQSADAYVVVEGILSFDPELLPVTDWDNQMATPSRTELPARLTGRSLTRAGFSGPFDAPVVLQINCAGPWCPRPQQGDALALLKRAGGTYTLTQGACGGMLFGAPSPESRAWLVEQFAPAPGR